jgi:hypothetical protein
MKSDPNAMCFAPVPSVRGDTSCRRRHNGWRLKRFYPRSILVWALVVGHAGALAVTDHALAQEPMVPPAVPNAYVAPGLRHHWYHFFSSYDGIPRTYSYIYSPRLNQPHHFRVVGPDGKTYWTSTVRGLPIGYQWLAP